MERISLYKEMVDSMVRDAFVARFIPGAGPMYFLVKRPRAMTSAGGGLTPSQKSYLMRTEQLKPSALETEMVDEHGPLVHDWRVARVVKRPNNPFLDHISVGRAANCDIVLQLPFVSKLHAQFSIDEKTGLRVSDRASSNGTFVNGERLTASRDTALHVGDRIRFGSLELELVDAGRLHDIVCAEVRPPR